MYLDTFYRSCGAETDSAVETQGHNQYYTDKYIIKHEKLHYLLSVWWNMEFDGKLSPSGKFPTIKGNWGNTIKLDIICSIVLL